MLWPRIPRSVIIDMAEIPWLIWPDRFAAAPTHTGASSNDSTNDTPERLMFSAITASRS
jgi:hypothetical protein